VWNYKKHFANRLGKPVTEEHHERWKKALIEEITDNVFVQIIEQLPLNSYLQSSKIANFLCKNDNQVILKILKSERQSKIQKKIEEEISKAKDLNVTLDDKTLNEIKSKITKNLKAKDQPWDELFQGKISEKIKAFIPLEYKDKIATLETVLQDNFKSTYSTAEISLDQTSNTIGRMPKDIFKEISKQEIKDQFNQLGFDITSEESITDIVRSTLTQNTLPGAQEKLHTIYNRFKNLGQNNSEDEFLKYLSNLFGVDFETLKEDFEEEKNILLEQAGTVIEDFPVKSGEKPKFYSSRTEKEVLETVKTKFNIQCIPSNLKIPTPSNTVIDHFKIDFILICDVLQGDPLEFDSNHIPKINTEVVLVGEYFGYTLSENERRRFYEIQNELKTQFDVDPSGKFLSSTDKKIIQKAKYEFNKTIKESTEKYFGQLINCKTVAFYEPNPMNDETLRKMIAENLDKVNILYTYENKLIRNSTLGKLLNWWERSNKTPEQSEILSKFVSLNNLQPSIVKKDKELSYVVATKKNIESKIADKIISDSNKQINFIQYILQFPIVQNLDRDKLNEIKRYIRRNLFYLSYKEQEEIFKNKILQMIGNNPEKEQSFKRILEDYKINLQDKQSKDILLSGYKTNNLNDPGYIELVQKKVKELKEAEPWKSRFNKIYELEQCMLENKIQLDIKDIQFYCDEISNLYSNKYEAFQFCETKITAFNFSKFNKKGSVGNSKNKLIMFNNSTTIIKNLVRLALIADELEENGDNAPAELITDQIEEIAEPMRAMETMETPKVQEESFPRVQTPQVEMSETKQVDKDNLEKEVLRDVLMSDEFTIMMNDLENGEGYDNLKRLINDTVKENL